MTRNKMARPYCIIDGVRYKLAVSEGVVRFPDDGRPIPNINKMTIEYIEGKRPLSDLFNYCINSGTSYYLVQDWFSKHGGNNHMTTQGKEPTKSFKYYGKK